MSFDAAYRLESIENNDLSKTNQLNRSLPKKLAATLLAASFALSVNATTTLVPNTSFELDANTPGPNDWDAPYGPGTTPIDGWPTTGLYFVEENIDNGGNPCNAADDDQALGGSKAEDGPIWALDPNPTSPPNGKSDLMSIFLAAEKVDVGPGQINDILYVAYESCVGGNGTLSGLLYVDDGDGIFPTDGMDPPTQTDPDGDFLFRFDFSPTGGGSTSIEMFKRIGGSWVSQPVPVGAIEGAAATSGEFGEVALNLTSLGIIPEDTCTTITVDGTGATITGGSLNSQPKDIVVVNPLEISNCGNLDVNKAGAGPADDFEYIVDQLDGEFVHDATLDVTGVNNTTEPDGDTAEIDAMIQVGQTDNWVNVISQPDYFIEETMPLPTDWTLQGIECTYTDIFQAPPVEVTVTIHDGMQNVPNAQFLIPPATFANNALPPASCTITNLFTGLDFGDAPDTYGTTSGVNGAAHIASAQVFIGATPPDTELDAVANSTASGDDGAGDDEDLVFTQKYEPLGGMTCGAYTTGLNEYCLLVPVTNMTANDAQLVGWIDFSGGGANGFGPNGMFETAERSLPDLGGSGTSVLVADSAGAAADNTFTTGNIKAGYTGDVVLVWTGLGDIDQQLDTTTFARIRITTDGSAAQTGFFSDASPEPTGTVNDGEVEDAQLATDILPVTLSSFSSIRSGSYVNVDWGTSSELFNVGFQLWGLDGTDGEWEKLHNWLVKSGGGNAVEPQSYAKRIRLPSSIDQLVSVGVSSVDSDGSEHYYGPFEVGQSYGDLGQLEPIGWNDVRAELDARMAEAGYIKYRVNGYRKVSVATLGAQSFSASTNSIVEFSVSSDGLYRITSAELAAAGIDWSGALRNDIALIDAAGDPVVRYVKSPRAFGSGGEIYFYGNAPDEQAGLYTDYHVYRLVLDRNRALNAPIQGKSGVASFSQSYIETSIVENDNQYILTSAADDPWLSTVVYSETDMPRLYGLPVPIESDADLSQAMVLHLNLGKSSNLQGSGDEHVVRGAVLSPAGANGVLYLETQTSNDTGLWEVEIDIPGNTPLTLNPNGDSIVGGEFSPGSGYGFSEMHVDSIGLSYARPYVSKGDDNHLEFTAPNTGEQGYEVIIPDVGLPWVFASDGNNLVRLLLESAPRSTDANGNPVRTVRFGPLLGQDSALASNPLRYWVGARDQAQTVSGLNQREIASQDSLLTQALGSNYLMIAHPTFMGASLDSYAAHKQSQGYTVAIINYLDVVDAYGASQAGPKGLTDYLNALEAQGNGIDYVLLVGGSTYDHTGNGTSGAVTFIPGHYGESNYSKFTVSDAPYVMDGEGNGFANIGRWPVRSMADLQVIVDKSLLWASTDHSGGEALLIAEHTVAGENIDFGAALASSVEPHIPANWNQTQVDVDDILAAGQAADPSYTLTQALAQAKGEIIAGLNSTPDVVLYNGHASTRQLSNQNLFKSGDIAQVTASGAEIWLPMSCYVTYYESTHVNTLAHQLMFSGNAVNITGAMLLSNQSENIQMGVSILDNTMNNGTTLGEAVNQAKAAQNNARVDINWATLGDPTSSF